MTNTPHFEVIIIGGSYSGLSAAMSLGRALRSVLILDSGKPCNLQTPHSHNFITHDGHTPAEISASAKEQVLAYKNVQFHQGIAIKGVKAKDGFEISTEDGKVFSCKKLIIASGLKDVMPPVKGFAECWGISVLHCPYCHGYEVKQEKTGVIMNGEMAFEMTRMISNWTKELSLFTNGPSTLTAEQKEKFVQHNIVIIETKIKEIEHKNGYIENLILEDGKKIPLKAIYAKPEMIQHCEIPKQLGCDFSEQGLIKIDAFQKTNIEGVFACGDNSNGARALAFSVSSGTMAGVMANRSMIEESF